MLISIVIPTFNRRAILQELLGHLNVYKQFSESISVEIIVVDDRSTDGTKEMVESEYPEICYVQGPGKGAAQAKRAGIEIANGDYIVALDDDVIPEKLWLESVIPALERGEALVQSKIVFQDLGQKNLKDESKQYFRTGFRWSMYPLLVINGGYREQYINNCAECGLFMSRSVLKAEPLDDPSLVSDFGESASFFLRISKRGYKVFFQPNSVLTHVGAHSGGGKEREKKISPRKECTPFATLMVTNFFIFARMSSPLRIPYMILYFLVAGTVLTVLQKKFCLHFFIKGIAKGLIAPIRQVTPYRWAIASTSK
jgi:GT2 family glycosyltransferase